MFKNYSFTKAFLTWIPLAVLATLICGLVYVAVQQNIRMSANDPQIQIAEDTAQMLQSGSLNLDASLPANVDIAKSLSPYVVIYDNNFNVISSTGTLDGHQPLPPQGVFEYAKKNGRNSITWQPNAQVRSAIVVVSYNNGTDSGYVLVGRSLREVEIRANNLLLQVAVGWIFILAALFVVVSTTSFFHKKDTSH